MTPTPTPPEQPNVPITHSAHPFWKGFSWGKFATALQAAAVIVPVFVAVLDKGDPNAGVEAKQLGDLVNSVIGQLAKGNE